MKRPNWKVLIMCCIILFATTGCSMKQEQTRAEVTPRENVIYMWKVKTFVEDVDMSSVPMQRFLMAHDMNDVVEMVNCSKDVFNGYSRNFGKVDDKVLEKFMQKDNEVWGEILKNKEKFMDDPEWEILKANHEVMQARLRNLQQDFKELKKP